MCLSPLLLAVFMCCPPAEPIADEAEVQAFSKWHVLNVDGTTATDELAGCAKDGLFLRLEFIPALLAGDELMEREIKPLDEWRIIPKVTDANGNYVSPFFTQDFLDYDCLGYCTTGSLWFDAEEVHWVSPDAPETMDPGWHYRWGYIDLPEAEGEYQLTVTVYPTADSDVPPPPGQPAIVNPQLGEGFVIYEAIVAVEASTHPMNLGNGTMSFLFDAETRQLTLDALKRVGQ
jgi:hypothetical protein